MCLKIPKYGANCNVSAGFAVHNKTTCHGFPRQFLLSYPSDSKPFSLRNPRDALDEMHSSTINFVLSSWSDKSG